MRVRLGRPLPRSWGSKADGIVAQADIGLTGSSRLRAKLLVFRNRRSLRRFWKNWLGHAIPHAAAAVNQLCNEHIEFPSERSYLECDPRYFCVIGLCRGFLSMEIISHEAVHAGFAYAKRRGPALHWKDQEYDEEWVAYPAGIIAAAINRLLHDRGLYDRGTE